METIRTRFLKDPLYFNNNKQIRNNEEEEEEASDDDGNLEGSQRWISWIIKSH